MVDKEEEMVYMIGQTYASHGWLTTLGKRWFFRPMGAGGQKTEILVNMGEVPYQERILLWPKGSTRSKIKIIFCDIRGDRYLAVTNPEDIMRIEGLRRENDALRLELDKINKKLLSLKNDDLQHFEIQKKKKEYDDMFGHQGNYFPNQQQQTTNKKSPFNG